MLLNNSLMTLAIGLGGSSLIGSVLGMFIKKIPHKWNDIFLGFCAGMMLAASIMCPVLLLPYLTALAGGAMLYVISDEMIPETHAHGYEKYATFALVVGVVMMLFVQKFV
jgi:ZIP family zinc transporter